MSNRIIKTATIAILGSALLFCAPTAMAEQNTPGSVIVFPYVDTRSTSGTLISIANAYLESWPAQRLITIPNGGEVCTPGDPLTFRVGDTGLHFIFFEMFTVSSGMLVPVDVPCQEFNFDVILSSQDVVTFDASDFIPSGKIGWLVCMATDPAASGDPHPWAFDFLTGDAYVVETQNNISWNYNGYPFLSSKVDDPIQPGLNETFESSPAVAIPDDNPAGVSDTITVPGGVTFNELIVDLKVTHTWLGDLCVTLEHDGTTIHLVDRMGADTGAVCHTGSPFGCAQDNMDVLLADDAAESIEDQCALNLTGTFSPNQPLSTFNAFQGDASGDWVMNVSDVSAADIGTFDRWSLHFPTAVDPVHCGKMYTDEEIGNNDGRLTFDGTEYEQWPDELLLARFWEETPRVGDPDFNDPLDFDFDSRLVLISPQNTIPAQRDWRITYRALFWNNDENTNGFPNSRTRNMVCMDVTSLRNLSAQFTDLEGANMDTDGNPQEPTGWALFDGLMTRDRNNAIRNYDPPMLGIFAQINVKTAVQEGQGQLANLDRFAEANDFFTRGFNGVIAEIQYRSE